MSVIAFDIGNENCVIAAAKRGGIDVLLNNASKRETPAVVSFGDKQRFMGSAGAAFAIANPKSTVSQIKRLIGKVYREVEEELKMLPFVTSEGPRGGILIELEYLKSKWRFTPVEILGMLFKHLKEIAEKNLESTVVDCVIGIPSYFTDLQRRLYLDAAHIAGLNPLSLIHDGTAIALGYGIYKTDLSDWEPTYVMFVDIGHCDTQVTVAAFEQGEMEILSHCFDHNLGGRDFDEVLFKHFAAKFNKKYKLDVYSNARASARLRASCKKVKKVLSANAEAPLSIECLIGDTDVRGIITREEFEHLSSELLERVIVPCKKALKDSGLRVDELYTTELVGSGSRIPAITKILTSYLRKEPTRTLDTSECVARGCALLCAMHSPTLEVRDYKITESFPYSIVIPSPQGAYMVFPKGSSYPIEKSMKHTINIPFYLQVAYIKERNFPAGISHTVGHFGIGPSALSDAEKADVEFNVTLNRNGIVNIDSATILEDTLHDIWKKILMADSYTIWKKLLMADSYTLKLPTSENLDVSTTDEELDEAKEKERILTEQDIKVEETKDRRNTLRSFVYETRSKLSGAYRSFALDFEKEELTKNLQETEDWLYEDSDDESYQDYTEKLKDLKKLLEPIEHRYMENAAKPLQDCIAYYCSLAESLPTDKKEKIINVCIGAVKWLNGRSKNHASPKTLSTDINYAIEFVESQCEIIIYSKPSSPRHQEPPDSDQSVESEQLMNFENTMVNLTERLQASLPKFRLYAEALPTNEKEEVIDVFKRAEEWVNGHFQNLESLETLLTDMNHAAEIFESYYQTLYPKHEEPDQRDQPVDSDQRDQSADSENAMSKAAKPLQACIEKYYTLAESLPAGKKEKIIDVCNRGEKLLNGRSQDHASRTTLSTDINYAIEFVESECKTIINAESSSSKHEEPKESDSGEIDQPADLDQRATHNNSKAQK